MFLVYPGGGWVGLLVLVATALISWFFLRHFLVGAFRLDTRRRVVDGDENPEHIELLKQRYARGEITQEEYKRMREDLRD